MQPDIHENLRRLLAGDPINDETKVVHLLVEARKLIEHEKALKQTLLTLEFYCNLGLHVHSTGRVRSGLPDLLYRRDC